MSSSPVVRITVLNAQDLRYEFVEAKDTYTSLMQSQGEIFNEKFEAAKTASLEATTVFDVYELEVDPEVWNSDVSRASRGLIDDLKARSLQHYNQRMEQYTIVDNAAASITQIWNV